MSELLAKISSYELFSNLLPGALFCIVCSHLGVFTLDEQNVILLLVVYYATGLSIGRIGSLVIEPLFRRLRWIQATPYDDFVLASKADEKIATLVEANNIYRGLLSTSLALLLAVLTFSLRNIVPSNPTLVVVLLSLLAMVLFAFAYMKQWSYIGRRVQIAKNLTTATAPEQTKSLEL